MRRLRPVTERSILVRLTAVCLAGTFGAWAIGSWTAALASGWLSALFALFVAISVIGLIHAWVVAPAARLAQETARSGELDAVTKTLNRHGITVKLFELMALADRYGNRLSVALVGVDNFQELVTEHGESAGDSILCAITEILTDTIRMPDRIGRYGEEQFLAILPETNLPGACQIAERIRHSVDETYIGIAPLKKVRLTVSAGVTMFRRGEDVEQILSRAGRLLEQAEAQGHNRVLSDLAA